MTGRIRYTEHIEEQGERLFRELEALQIEGMVAKRKDSVYTFARSRLWLKVKTAAGRAEMQKRSIPGLKHVEMVYPLSY